jgi:hypothetical protein
MRGLWQKIEYYSRVVGDFQARLILTILYGLFVLPTGLIAKIGGVLLETHPRKTDSYWQARSDTDTSLRGARGQG